MSAQLDFQLPQRFGLQYTGLYGCSPLPTPLSRHVAHELRRHGRPPHTRNDPPRHPWSVTPCSHRRDMAHTWPGSLERFFAILTEHTAGVWPLWLNPRQAWSLVSLPDPYVLRWLFALSTRSTRAMHRRFALAPRPSRITMGRLPPSSASFALMLRSTLTRPRWAGRFAAQQ